MKNYLKIIAVMVLCYQLIGCISPDKDPSADMDDQILIEINPAIELISTIHYLAGTGQYDEMLLPDHLAKVENYFGHLRDHPAVVFSKESNILFDINGSAPMALAVYLGPPPLLQPRIDLSTPPDDFDPRWTSTLINDFLEKARAFAIESNFMDFFNHHQDFHGLAVNNLKKMLHKEYIYQWYHDFFGYYPDHFKLYIGLLNGSCNYGFPVTLQNGEKEFVSLLGARWPDKNGAPIYRKDWFLPVVIHEYCHSYINPLTISKPEEFMELGEALLNGHRNKMVEHGYNVWNVILNEYIVRACTIRFIAQNEGKRKARQRIQYDEKEGFPAIGGLVKLLDEYEENRSEYPGIESFLPQVKKYFESYLAD